MTAEAQAADLLGSIEKASQQAAQVFFQLRDIPTHYWGSMETLRHLVGDLEDAVAALVKCAEFAEGRQEMAAAQAVIKKWTDRGVSL
ncbi:hypothetical protein SEA_REDRAIDER77_4 [Mycobacterium phage RedRaider77]|uniref:Uncharacterized protein n=1 Tax=Mycobacterium phage RedRaider77 TaxID=2500794 RepID=A0A411AY78_9CAUD|nr:hypothetical protein SEA_REDRAIDER77_4 [Mycobacterium phage RedRaider77]